jgi:hypothetical protein
MKDQDSSIIKDADLPLPRSEAGPSVLPQADTRQFPLRRASEIYPRERYPEDISARNLGMLGRANSWREDDRRVGGTSYNESSFASNR